MTDVTALTDRDMGYHKKMQRKDDIGKKLSFFGTKMRIH